MDNPRLRRARCGAEPIPYPLRISEQHVVGKLAAALLDEVAIVAEALKELEQQNGRLKKAVADLTLDKQILEEALKLGN